MPLADLQRLIQRATPRTEDVRSPDRTDIIRREHGHLTLREIVDAVDALEYGASAFLDAMDRLQQAELGQASSGSLAPHTAVHGLARTLGGLVFLTPSLTEAVSTNAAELGGGDASESLDAEAAPEELAEAAEARKAGAECFKAKDFAGAEAAFTKALRLLPAAHADRHALYSNRSAARLQMPKGDAAAALADARCCVRLAPQWPKGFFREGSCLRQLARFGEAARALEAGAALEPDNKDWGKEIERTEHLRSASLPAVARQLVCALAPELLSAWARGGDETGVLQIQANGDLHELGAAKWRLVRESKTPAKAQLRYAFLSRKDYLCNLAANLQTPIDGVAVVDVSGAPLKIAEIGAFLPEASARHATIHIDVKCGKAGKMAAILCHLPCDQDVMKFLGSRKDPEAPRGTVESVLQLQKSSGFPKVLPRYLGFQSLPGVLNYPVIDLARDAPAAKAA